MKSALQASAHLWVTRRPCWSCGQHWWWTFVVRCVKSSPKAQCHHTTAWTCSRQPAAMCAPTVLLSPHRIAQDGNADLAELLPAFVWDFHAVACLVGSLDQTAPSMPYWSGGWHHQLHLPGSGSSTTSSWRSLLLAAQPEQRAKRLFDPEVRSVEPIRKQWLHQLVVWSEPLVLI